MAAKLSVYGMSMSCGQSDKMAGGRKRWQCSSSHGAVDFKLDTIAETSGDSRSALLEICDELVDHFPVFHRDFTYQ